MQFDLTKILNNIKIVLVATTHPGNIGAVARAMKTMGLSRLVLVQPRIFPAADATARAAGANDILENAVISGSLEEAVSDCNLVYATSARLRNLPWPVMDPETAGETIISRSLQGAVVAVVFGRESSGLSNRDIEFCNAAVRISTNDEFSSLNIASAVQIISYELRKHASKGQVPDTPPVTRNPEVTGAQMSLLYEHLEQCLIDLEFYNPERPRLLMRRLKRIFNRLQLDENEYNIIRGILAAAQKSARGGGPGKQD